MNFKRLGGIATALGLAFTASACVDDYGYGGMEVGYGNAGYYGAPYDDGYGYSGYGGYGGYGPSYYGWYGDYYYPGTGIYVYDQYRRPYRWNDSQRRYWSAQQRYRGRDWNGSGSWNGFDRRTVPGYTGDRQWQGNPQWRDNRNGYVPRSGATDGGDYRRWQGNNGAQGYRGDPGRQGYRGNGGTADSTRTYTAPPPRSPGQWSGRTGRGGRSPEQ